MKKKISVLGIDVGQKTGWCFKNDSGEQFGSILLDKNTPHIDFRDHILEFIAKLSPSAIVYGKPYFMPFKKDVQNRHYKYAGVLCLIAEIENIYLFEMGDATARKKVFGKGNLKKDECQKMTGIDDPDASDATVLARAIYQDLILANP